MEIAPQNSLIFCNEFNAGITLSANKSQRKKKNNRWANGLCSLRWLETKQGLGIERSEWPELQELAVENSLAPQFADTIFFLSIFLQVFWIVMAPFSPSSSPMCHVSVFIQAVPPAYLVILLFWTSWSKLLPGHIQEQQNQAGLIFFFFIFLPG